MARTRWAGNAHGVQGKNVVYDPNDIARVTIKETNIHDNRTGNLATYKKPLQYDPNDIARVTTKETAIMLDNMGNYLSNIYTGNMSMLGGICITKENLPDLGDSNNDNIINVIDIIKIINYILNNTMIFSPYEIFASDLTLDNTIDISDVVSIINLIID